MIFLIRMKWRKSYEISMVLPLLEVRWTLYSRGEQWLGVPTIRKTTLWKCSWCRSWGTNLQQQKFQHHLDHIISMTISQTTASWILLSACKNAPSSFHARKWGYSFLADLLGASLNLSFLSKNFPQHIPRTYPKVPQLTTVDIWRNSWIICGCLGMGYANQGYVGVLLDSW